MSMTKGNILEIISAREQKIKELKRELIFVHSEIIKDVVNRKIGDLEDDLYRYKLQARAWGLID